MSATTYYNVNVFGKNLVEWASLFQKGDNLVVQGNLKVSEVDKDGKHYKNNDILSYDCNFDLQKGGLPKRLTEGNAIVTKFFEERSKREDLVASQGQEQTQGQAKSAQVETEQEQTFSNSEIMPEADLSEEPSLSM